MNRPMLRAHKPGTARRCELVHGKSEDTLYVYGVIGESFFEDGVTAAEVAKAVRESKAARLNVRINSPGGDVFEGVAMAQALRDFDGELIAYVDGLAASAATFLTTAASKTLMAKGSMLMIHQAWTVAMGNADELITQAALLEKIDGQIAKQYAERAGVAVELAMQWMQDETWFTEQEAVDAHLADGIQGEDADDDGDASARLRQWDPSAFAHPPAVLLVEPEMAEPPKEEATRTYHEFEQRSRIARLLDLNPA